MTGQGGAPAASKARRWRRFLPLAVLLSATAGLLAFGVPDQISCTALHDNRDALTALVAGNQVAAALVFIAAYALVVAASLPIGVVLSFAAGLLFGPWMGTAYVVTAATLGATALFLAARSALGESLRARAGSAVARMEQGFREHAASYLLFLRLTPVFPFWLVNLVPAAVGVPLRTFVAATFVGIIPGTFVFVSVGHGLNAIFQSGGSCDPRLLLQWHVMLPLVALALLALVPVAYNKLRQRRAEARVHD